MRFCLSPLAANLYAADVYGCFTDWSDELSPADLCSYQSAIMEQIQRERLESEGERGLAVYLHDAALEQKVYSMQPAVEVWQGELWGVLEVKSHGALSPDELAALTEQWCGQQSDGWGEGFEQRPIKTEDGELFVRFLQPDSDFFIVPEEKLKQQPEPRFGIQMGAM